MNNLILVLSAEEYKYKCIDNKFIFHTKAIKLLSV